VEESEEEDAFIGGLDGAADDDDDEGKFESMDMVKLYLTTIQIWMISLLMTIRMLLLYPRNENAQLPVQLLENAPISLHRFPTKTSR
jgi:hypothetical protein